MLFVTNTWSYFDVFRGWFTNIKGIKINLLKNKKDPDKRDYFVSNKKIERAGYKTKISLDKGIRELFQLFTLNDFQKNKNNY